ncbi:MAG: Pectinesterase [Bacteroidota bacterium]|jgi:hypothetical protein|nr:Pectinesterase [Bacteroidota bacterium]
MKKIYSLAVGFIFCGSIMAQGSFMPEGSLNRAQKPANAKAPLTTYNSPDRVLGPKYWVEPVGDIMNNFGIDLTGASAGQSQGNFLSVIYMDSTTRVSSGTSTETVGNIMLGSVLDPKSPNLDPSFTPILTASEAYSIDSIQIIGSYVKVTTDVDTLYTWLVWGDSSQTTVFSKRSTGSIWVSPISTWRTSIIGPKVSGYTAAIGNKVKAAAPAANMKLIKYVLTDDDASQGAGYSKVISIALPQIANIPAGKIVSCFYTFVPGGTHNTGDVSYSFDGSPDAQQVNGFAGMIWSQTSPQVAAVSDYEPQQIDPDGWNMGASYYMEQRHALYPSTYNNSLWGNLTTAPLIYYSIYSNTSVGVNEVASKFTLGQNVPNPMTNSTKINYQLKSSANNVSLAIYNVAGVKVFEKTQSNLGAGNYSVDVTENFTSGMYFYSLTVDGNKVTKKMTVAK